jgi:hypothetical protein
MVSTNLRMSDFRLFDLRRSGPVLALRRRRLESMLAVLPAIATKLLPSSICSVTHVLMDCGDASGAANRYLPVICSFCSGICMFLFSVTLL